LPRGHTIYQNDANVLDFNQSIRIHGTTISSIDINFTFKDMNLYSETNSTGGAFMIQDQDVNALKLLYDLNGGVGVIKMIIKFNLADGNVLYYSQSYTFIGYSSGYNIENMLRFGIPALFGETNPDGNNPTLLFLALFITMVVISGLAIKLSIGFSGVGVMLIAFMGFWAWLGWINPTIAVLLSIGAIALILFSWRGG